MNDVRIEQWQKWIIYTAEISDVNLANVAKITIGFGEEGIQAASDGVVYFDNIRLYPEYPPPKKYNKVVYDDEPNYLREPRWHVWNIELAEFNDVNLANIERITIGFGDGNQAENDSAVYFENILLGCGKTEFINDDGSVYLDEDPFVNGYDSYPLLLKQDCPLIDAGGDYIDELRNLVGKTTAWEGTPDNIVADIGFHYFNWYYANAGERSPADLDDSNTVDFRDFAILADGWQTTYDINNLKIMADEWLKIAEPNIQLQIAGDGNNGFVEIGASDHLSDTQRIFLLADGQYVGEIFGFRSGYPFGMDISEFGGGEHQLKTISVDRTCNITCSNVTDAAFTCPLNYCLLPTSYEPNKPLHFSAFNPYDGDVSVKVYADCGTLVWSQSYNGNSILGSIPADITSQHEIDYVNFDAGSVGVILKITDPKEPELQGSIRALIILPNLYIRLLDINTILAVQTAFKNRGIKYKKLGGATYNIIALYAATNPIKYIYIDAHGGYGKEIIPETGSYYYEFDRGILRTWVELSDGRCFSMKQSDSGAPSWCRHLGYWEGRSKSFASMGFEFLEFVHFDGCYGGHLTINDDHDELVEGQPGEIGQVYDGPISDISIALGMHEPSTSRFYMGWYDESTSRAWPFRTDYQEWGQNIWERLGDEDNLQIAIAYAISQQENLWNPKAPANAYRLKGQGFPWDIFLRD